MRANPTLCAVLFVLASLLLAARFSHAQANNEPITAVSDADVIPDAYMAGSEATAARLFRAESEASRKDEGLVSYEVFRDIGALNHFTVVETWHDAKAYALHVGSRHAVQFRQAVQPFLGSPFDVRLDRQLR